MSGHVRALALGLIVALAASCAHYPVNPPSHEFNKETGYRFDALSKAPENTDSLFVCLTFSGGGTRAAALAYGVMHELRQTQIVLDGVSKNLLEEVDCISSVSGGSFASAYYGLFRDRLFEDFREEFLDRNIQGALFRKVFNPFNWFRLASPYFGRIDLAADVYERTIFRGMTFSHLQENGRPFVIINATNLGTGRRFDFTQVPFDAMGSDLENYSVARAVAASSAFPFLLSAISLKNYPTAPNYETPGWYQGALAPEDWTSRRYDAARNLSDYLNKTNRFVHLMDGGLADNIGTRAILDAYDRGFIRTRINNGDIDKLIVIVVNARTESEDRLSKKEAPPGLVTVAEKTATVAMDNYSFESVALLRSKLYERVQTQKDLEACARRLEEGCPDAPPLFLFEADVDPYVVEINFEAISQIPGEDPAYYLHLPTSFKLTGEQVENLIHIGPKLMAASPQYQCLLKVLEAEAHGDPRPPDCPVGAGIVGQ